MLRQLHLWIYVENPMESTQEQLKLIKFSKGAGYKIIIQKSVVFL